jgi:amino acid adenylation domain-containing protein/non-ribosomal peptide synthase protein (TIGR01720 family)
MKRNDYLDRLEIAANQNIKEKEYWLSKLSGDLSRTRYPHDYIGNGGAEYCTNEVKFKFNGEIFSKLKELSKEKDQTLFLILTAGLVAVLDKHINSRDIILGTTIYNPGVEGDFINTLLALRNQVREGMIFKDLLIDVRHTIMEAYEHQNYPFEVLVRQLNLESGGDEVSLFDIAILLTNIHDRKHLQGMRLDMAFSFLRINEHLEGVLEYNPLLYCKTTMERMTVHLENFFKVVLFNLDIKVDDVEIMLEEEKRQLLVNFNSTEADYRRDAAIYTLIEERMERIPGKKALTFEGEQLTYGEINRRSGQLAVELREKGVGPDTIIGIKAGRSLETIVAIFAILKAGGAYLPIDLGYPQKRIDLILKDCGAKLLLLARKDEKVARWEGERIYIDAKNRINYSEESATGYRSSATSLAYVIYTSGSTGKPKGVMIENSSLVNRLNWMQKKYSLTGSDIILHKTPFTFDVSVWEIFWWAVEGAGVCLLKTGRERNPEAIINTISKTGVSVIHFVPSMLNAFLNYIKETENMRKLASLKQVIASGEVLAAAQVDLFNQLLYTSNSARLANLYGPTEATIDVSYFDCSTGETFEKIPIGRPIDNIYIYILGRNLNLQPIGIAGELSIAGIGLGRGYLNRPELTSEKFIFFAHELHELNNKKTPKSKTQNLKLYRTGDIARWLPDGNIDYLGRMDNQIKIRGFRIELDEIENHLMTLEHIKEAAVINRTDDKGDTSLAAYIVSSKTLDKIELRDILYRSLPDYMVPTYFVQIPRIPLTSNGKTDRSKLPVPDVENKEQYVPPGNKTEEKIFDTWKDVLELKRIGINDNFFNIGGDSIKAIRLISLINKRYNANVKTSDLFFNNTISKLAQLVSTEIFDAYDREWKEAKVEIEGLKTKITNSGKISEDVEDIFPMNDIQKGMIFYSYKTPEDSLYHDQFVYQRAYSMFEPDILRRALQLMTEKHSILRTSFNIEDFGEFVHFIHKPFPPAYKHFDISELDRSSIERFIVKYIEDDRKNKWNISSPPLWRMATFSLNSENICVVWTFHHAILDGWSNASLMTELNNTYLALKTDKNYIPDRLRISYKEFIIQEVAEKKKTLNIDFWKNELEGYKRIPFPDVDKTEANEFHDFVPNHSVILNEKLLDASRRYNTSLKHLCFSAYVYMLSMLTYENDVVVGLISNNRPEKEDGDKLIGCFLNTLPFRLNIPPGINWKEYIHLVDRKLLQLKRFEKITFFEIVKAIGERNRGENPIFDTIFNYIDFHIYQQAVADIEAKTDGEQILVQGYERTNTLFDFTVKPYLQGITVTVRYSTSIINDQLVKKLYGYFENILKLFISRPEELIKRDEIFSNEEKQELLYEFNDTDTDCPKDKAIHQLFEEQVQRIPDHIALVGQSARCRDQCEKEEHFALIAMPSTITYKELNRKSDQFAYFLKEKGVPEGNIVGIMVERSVEMIIGIMGILKAGCAYLPIDPAYPDERIKYMLSDSASKVLVTTSTLVGNDDKVGSWEGKKILIEQIPSSLMSKAYDDSPLERSALSNRKDRGVSNLAYIIYTSGSTGKPRGVMLEHQNLVNLLLWGFKFTSLDFSSVLQFATISFDASFHEIFSTFLYGGKLFLLTEELRTDIPELFWIIMRNKIKTVFFPISFLKVIFNESDYANIFPVCVRHIQTAGEQVVVSEQFARYLKTHQIYLHNHYGPAETHVVTAYTVKPTGEIPKLPPIGKPVSNTKILIVDKYMNLQPMGLVGELLIGGIQVGRGYLNRPELTAEKFIQPQVNTSLHISTQTRFPQYSTIYRTGDMAKWKADGNIEFLGRIDSQVKIRGFRIELGEIESHLLNHNKVKEAVALLRENPNGDKYICVYIVTEKEFTVSQLSTYLSNRLPDYMLPSYFIKLDKIPLTPNGKVDRKALPEPETTTDSKYLSPRNQTERKLTEIWAEVLGVKKEALGIDANFFELGGHSLTTIRLLSKLQKEFDVKLSPREIFKFPTIRAFGESLKLTKKEIFASIKQTEEKDYYRLSSEQKRLYILHQMESKNTSYNMPLRVVLEGELEREKLEKVFRNLIKRHDSLRTSFILIDEEPVQRVHSKVEFEVEYYDTKKVEDKGQRTEDRRQKTEEKRLTTGNGQQTTGVKKNTYPSSVIRNLLSEFIRPFDLSKAPLLRVGLIKIGETRHILMVDMHHIITDGVSHAILIKDFIDFYKGIQLSRLTFQYKDFAEWQNRDDQRKVIESQREYWLNEFEGEIPLLNLPTDYTRPEVQSFEGSILSFEICIDETKALNQLAKKQGATLYIVLLAVFNVLLAKLTNQEDIIIGSPLAGRRHVDLEQIIGMFANTLALRNFPDCGKKFIDFLGEVKENTLNAFENPDYPFEELVEHLSVDRDIRYNPLFDVMLSFQNMDFPEVEIPGLKISPYEHKNRIAKFDLELSAVEAEEKLLFSFEYCTKLFKQETIVRFISFYKKIISSILNNPDQKISQIEIIPEQEKKQILFDFNDTDAEYPQNKTIPELFEKQVERTPDNIAVVGNEEGWKGRRVEDEKNYKIQNTNYKQNSLSAKSQELIAITYKELNEQSEQLAYLLMEKGIQPDTIVGIMLERSIGMIIGIMGILKAGSAYLPIDPEYPKERIEYIRKDSDAKIVLTGSDLSSWLSSPPKALLNLSEGHRLNFPASQLPNFPASLPSSLAYIIYTSGSTGKPKAVMIKHSSLVNACIWQVQYYNITKWDRITQYASVVFDASVLEIFSCFIQGASLHIVDEEVRLDIIKLNQYYEKSGITMCFLPTQIGEKFMELENRSLRVLLVAGDKLRVFIKRGYRVYNNYGPTENTVVTAAFLVDKQYPNIPIGKPIYNNYLYILSQDHSHLQPVGVGGELCIAGASLSFGYLNNPELTAEKFIDYKIITNKEVPFAGKVKLYKTGDLARWLSDGNIEFLGRIDYQVKIRSFRIELGEIESELLAHDNIKEVVVVSVEDKIGNKYLCAYFVSKKEFTVSHLRSYLSERLPDYMLPSFFIPLEKIPLTPSGKVDRKHLPDPKSIDLRNDGAYIAPKNIIEKELTRIWQEVLAIKSVSIDDNFFEIGGDSIKTIQIISRMKKAGYKLEMKEIFQNPRISELAPFVKKIERISDKSVITGIIPLTPIQKWFFEKQLHDRHHFNHAVMLYSKEGFEGDATKAVFKKLQEHHDALRIIYKNDNDTIIQVNQGLDHPLSLQVFDYRKQKNARDLIESKANEIQASIDLEIGPLMKLALFHLKDGDHLLIVCHHLVIDGVSWRTLFEDIETLYQQYKKNKPLTLPLKTDSFKVWSEKLCEYANSDQFLKEKNYWSELESKSIPQIKKDFENEDNHMKDVESISFSLEETDTHLLLTKVNEAFGTGINDILLTALGVAIKMVYGNDRLLVALEGHGREEILEDIEVSRTVGWFTSLYPVFLVFPCENEKDPDRNLASQIKDVKESLRQVPHNGVGYGILKYLTAEENKEGIHFILNPQVIFNYLGQFDEDLEHRSFSIAKESVGYTHSPNEQREFEIEVSGLITNKQLTMSISFSRKQYKQETITELLEHFKRELIHLITYCSSREKNELTPSDLTYPEISIAALDRLQVQYSYLIEDIYPLTPMQEGMVFYALFENKNRTTYFLQMSYRLQGELNVPLVEKSLNELFKRHDVLRTVFIYEGLNRPLQVVLKERNVEFYFEDLRKSISNHEIKEKLVSQFNDKDRQRSFDLSKDVLMRVAVLQVEDSEYQVTWSSYHILMDGWCIGILISEFFEIYTSCLENRTFQLSTIKPYRTYIQWLEKQEKNKARNYWQKYLEGYEEIAALPRKEDKGTFEGGYKSAAASTRFEEEKTIALNKVAIRNHVTLNTVLQVIWAIALGKYCCKQDIVFGVLISGRPPEIEGVESMIGCFINTIPVRITFDQNIRFNELLRIVQDRAIESEPHYYYSLAEIQAESPLKQNLLDHIIEFQNYPPAERIEGVGDQIAKNKTTETLKLSNLNISEQSNYNFNVVIVPGDQIYLGFGYNANLYDSELVEQLGINCIRVLEQIIEDDTITIDEIAILSEEERRKILFEFNNNRADFPRDKTIYQFVEKYAEMTPDHVAIVGKEEGGKGRRVEGKKENAQDENSLRAKSQELIAVTYKELNERANQLAKVLSNSAVQKDEPVGILMERSHAMVESILAVWKSGGAYMPIDPAYPDERIDHLLSDSKAKVLVTTSSLAEEGKKVRRFEGKKVLLEEVFRDYYAVVSSVSSVPSVAEFSQKASLNLSEGRHPDFPASQLPSFPASLPSSLAYIIYTSGSTGKPKGVMIEHMGMMNHIQAKINDLQLTPESIVAQNATHTFDISIWQFFAALTVRGRIVIYTDELIMDPGRFLSWLVKDQVTIIEVVPSYLSVLLDYTEEQSTLTLPLSLHYLLVTGEELKPYLVKKWFDIYPDIKMVNAYGPTEASDDITHYIMDSPPDMERIPIGKPLQNMNIYIVDHRMQLCPIGVRGEICVSGVGVGRGYLGDEEKTKQVFIKNPFFPPTPNDQCPMTSDSSHQPHSTIPLTTHHSPLTNNRLYKTGDLGAWLPDGTILFFGRKDYQLKIRGFRIELGEIENRLLSHPGIKEAVVIDREDKTGNKYLCAYVVPRPNHSPGVTKLKEYLLKYLPDYMIPAHFMLLENIPLTSSGKVDRKALPAPEGGEITSGYVAPGNHVEKKLVEIWSEVLGKEEGIIGVSHNFFDLGGHSLKAIVLVSKIHKEFDVKIPLAELFRTPTIRDLYHYIKKASEDYFASIEPVEKKEYYVLSSAQKRLYILQQMDLASDAYNLPQLIPLTENTDLEKFSETFIKLIERHESLRTSFHIINDQPVQKVHDIQEVDFKIEYYELSPDSGEQEIRNVVKGERSKDRKGAYITASRNYLIKYFNRAFDLSQAPLLKVGVVKAEQDKYFLVVVMHHIISDAISHTIIVKDFKELYNGEELPGLRLQYKDYAEWRNRPEQIESIKKQGDYWLKEFEKEIPVLNLPFDYKRPDVRNLEGEMIHFVIDKEKTSALKHMVAEQGATLHMILLTLFNVLLSKVSNQEDIIIGSPAAGRRHIDLGQIIGMFVNTIVFRNYPTGDKPFKKIFSEVKEKALEAFENQDFQFDDLVERVVRKRDANRNPIFDVMIMFQDQAKLETSSPEIENTEPNKADVVWDLLLTGKETGENLSLTFGYRTSLFKAGTIKKFIKYFKEIISAVIEDEERNLKDIKISHELFDKKIAIPQAEGDFVF